MNFKAFLVSSIIIQNIEFYQTLEQFLQFTLGAIKMAVKQQSPPKEQQKNW